MENLQIRLQNLCSRDSKGFQALNNVDKEKPIPSIPFSKGQMEHLSKLFSGSSTSSSSLMAQKGTTLTSYSGLTDKGEPWIIDSGASDHMSSCEKMFLSCSPCAGNQRVKIIDGSYSVVARIGSTDIGPNITLRAVLHVPKRSYNLLSISKITKDVDSVVNFSSFLRVFQDRTSGRRIGSGKELSGLLL